MKEPEGHSIKGQAGTTLLRVHGCFKHGNESTQREKEQADK